jgi:hypothetical protein
MEMVMNQLDYLKTGKRFLRKVARQRKNLQAHGEGYLPPSLSNGPDTMLYHLTTIHSADQLLRYLHRKESEIKMMIPANCIKWFDELRELLAGVEERVEN